jgi:hypothetical protein
MAVEIPVPKPGDSEKLVSSLENAALFRRIGDYEEAVRWLQRAAELSGETGDDARTLSLARTAAELSDSLRPGAEPPRNADGERMKILPKPPARSRPPQPAPTPADANNTDEPTLLLNRPASRSVAPAAEASQLSRPPPPSSRPLASRPAPPSAKALPAPTGAPPAKPSTAPNQPSTLAPKTGFVSYTPKPSSPFTQPQPETPSRPPGASAASRPPKPNAASRPPKPNGASRPPKPNGASRPAQPPPSEPSAASGVLAKPSEPSHAAPSQAPPNSDVNHAAPSDAPPSIHELRAELDAANGAANASPRAVSANGASKPAAQGAHALRQAARVSVEKSATEPGLFLVRLLDDEASLPAGKSEALLVSVDPNAALF